MIGIEAAGAELARRTRAAQGLPAAVDDAAGISGVVEIAARALRGRRTRRDEAPPKRGPSSNPSPSPSPSPGTTPAAVSEENDCG